MKLLSPAHALGVCAAIVLLAGCSGTTDVTPSQSNGLGQNSNRATRAATVGFASRVFSRCHSKIIPSSKRRGRAHFSGESKLDPNNNRIDDFTFYQHYGQIRMFCELFFVCAEPLAKLM
jgi:hypothetical protein